MSPSSPSIDGGGEARAWVEVGEAVYDPRWGRHYARAAWGAATGATAVLAYPYAVAAERMLATG